LVHVHDPLAAGDIVVEALAAAFAPACRVLSIEPRGGQPYQVQAADVRATLEQFGFDQPAAVLIGEGLGCVAALLVAAWHPGLVSQLVLVEPTHAAPHDHERSVEARALHECPPDWPALRNAVGCPVLEMPWNGAALETLRTFVQLP
jgi:pimeloyl-ACP methyl ester carboxylesterase